MSPTPGIDLRFLAAVGDPAAVLLAIHGCEVNALGQVKAPVGLEGQVGLVGVGHLLVVLQEVDAKVWWVEAAHVANQDILLTKKAWFVAVQLHFRWRCGTGSNNVTLFDMVS